MTIFNNFCNQKRPPPICEAHPPPNTHTQAGGPHWTLTLVAVRHPAAVFMVGKAALGPVARHSLFLSVSTVVSWTGLRDGSWSERGNTNVTECNESILYRGWD